VYHGPWANGDFNKPFSLRYDALASGAVGTDKARREHMASQCQARPEGFTQVQKIQIYTGELYIL